MMSNNTLVVRGDATTESDASSFMMPLNHQSMSTVNQDKTIIERVNESNVFSNLSLEDEPIDNNESPNHASQNRTTSDFGGSQFDNRLSGMHNNRMSGLPKFNELASSAH